MKTRYAAVAAGMAALLAVGPAAAADYMGTASFEDWAGVWRIAWPLNVSPCITELNDQVTRPHTFTVDGATRSTSAYSITHGPPAQVYFNPGPPDGLLTRATVNGADHLTCGADRLLLPGYVAPPTPVPTLSEWAMILLGVMLAGGALTLRRRRQAG